MNKEWKFCDNCQKWTYFVVVGDRTFCETCGCAPGQKADERTYQPTYTQERDWRILKWRCRWGGDLTDDAIKGIGNLTGQVAIATCGLRGPSESEAKQ